jgi:hypothetical protein
MRAVRSGLVGCLGIALLLAAGSAVRATVEMQKEARKAGFDVPNCLYCHASKHAAKVMKDKARQLNMNEGNCLLCHGSEIPAALNERGEWLVAERHRRGAKRVEMSWLVDYVEPKEGEPQPSPSPTATLPPAPRTHPTPRR